MLNQIALALSYQSINTAVAAVMMLIMNITGGQIVAGLTPVQKKALQSPYVKWITVFAVIYVGTRNIWLTVVLTLLAVLIMDILLNEHSRYYLFQRQRFDGKTRAVGTGALHAWRAQYST